MIAGKNENHLAFIYLFIYLFLIIYFVSISYHLILHGTLCIDLGKRKKGKKKTYEV